MRYSSYELKYCERCGGLGLRRNQSGSPYCSDCEQMMRAFLPRSGAGGSASGQLRRIVQRLQPSAVVSACERPAVQEATHAC